MFRKDRDALGNTLVTFTNKNNNSLQINYWLGMRSLWHGSKIDLSLALKRKLCVPGGKRMNRARICWVLQVREEACSLDVVVLASDEVVGVLGSFRQLDENSVKLWKSLPKGKMGRDGRMRLEIAEFQI